MTTARLRDRADGWEPSHIDDDTRNARAMWAVYDCLQRFEVAARRARRERANESDKGVRTRPIRGDRIIECSAQRPRARVRRLRRFGKGRPPRKMAAHSSRAKGASQATTSAALALPVSNLITVQVARPEPDVVVLQEIAPPFERGCLATR